MPTLEEFDAKLAGLRSQKESIQEELRSLAAERDALEAEESAQQKVLAMSPAERKALGIPEPQVIDSVGGIESEESVQG